MAEFHLPTSIICLICQDPLIHDQGNIDVVSTTCGHVFHKPCIESWLTNKNGTASCCPNCYAKIRTSCCKKLFLSVDQEDSQATKRLRQVETMEMRCATLESQLVEKERKLLGKQREKDDLHSQVMSLRKELSQKEKGSSRQIMLLKKELAQKEKERSRQVLLLREELAQKDRERSTQFVLLAEKDKECSRQVMLLRKELTLKENEHSRQVLLFRENENELHKQVQLAKKALAHREKQILDLASQFALYKSMTLLAFTFFFYYRNRHN